MDFDIVGQNIQKMRETVTTQKANLKFLQQQMSESMLDNESDAHQVYGNKLE